MDNLFQVEIPFLRRALFASLLAVLCLTVADRPTAEAAERVVQDLLALYTFERPQDDVIRDRSGTGEPLNLKIEKTQGIAFRGGRLIVTSSARISSVEPARKIVTAVKQSNALSIEAWVKPQDTRQAGPARIVSLSVDPGQRDFTLGQDGGRYDVRLRTTSTDGNGIPSTAGPDASLRAELTHVVYTRDPKGSARIYLNGKEVVTGTVAGPLANWSDDFRLMLANELTGDRPWLGELHLIAIYGRALTKEEVTRNFAAGAPAVKYSAMLPPASPRQVDFVKDVQPLLRKHCYECHAAGNEEGGVNLGIRERVLEGGDHGPVLIPGDSANSRLIHLVAALDKQEMMPPDAKPLSREDVGLLRAWIDQGTKWPDGADVLDPRAEKAKHHWAFQRLHPVAEPPVRDTSWARTPVDRFILAGLEARSIAPNPPADRRTLVRRLYFDMQGLPPSPEDVAAFVGDQSPSAYEDLVDRMLKSPHYGERWGRHWLDLARYADSDGLETDADRPNAYHFRDFVIRALNDDLSYQTFVRWQLAGDEYEPDNPAALAATGFLTGAPTEFLTVPMEEEKLRLRFNELDDMAVATASAFLGLTLGCARCHDHKFDAIPTRDYYRLQCAFTTTARDNVMLATRADVARYREQEAAWNERLKTTGDKLNSWLNEQKMAHTTPLRNAKIDALAIGDEEKKLLREQPDSESAKKLAKQHENALDLSDDDYRRAFSDDQRRQWDTLKNELEAAKGSRPASPPTALAITDRKAQPEPTWLLERGDFYAKKTQLQLGFLAALTGARAPEDYLAAARREGQLQNSTGQRRALADWMTDVEHGAGALLARVIVNRVWQHHFGEGLSRTVSDFGVRSEPPTHPELLEWLTHQFVAGGWRLKSLHRLILTSAAYLQTTTFNPARAQTDPDNRLLWRRRPQRLESEILRDAVLAVSGTLNTEQFGPAFKPPIAPEAIVARNTKNPYPKDARDNPATRRRTVYMFHKRVTQHPLMQAFDGPDASVSCGRRNNTTVAPQALALLNDTFLRDRATDFARRLLAPGATTKTDDAVDRGFRLALSRPPNDVERAASMQFVDSQVERRAAREKSLSPEEIRLQALADFCQALFSLNEFIYVD